MTGRTSFVKHVCYAFFHGKVDSFSDTILLRGIGARVLPYNPRWIHECLKLPQHVLSSLVIPDLLDRQTQRSV